MGHTATSKDRCLPRSLSLGLTVWSVSLIEPQGQVLGVLGALTPPEAERAPSFLWVLVFAFFSLFLSWCSSGRRCVTVPVSAPVPKVSPGSI